MGYNPRVSLGDSEKSLHLWHLGEVCCKGLVNNCLVVTVVEPKKIPRWLPTLNQLDREGWTSKCKLKANIWSVNMCIYIYLDLPRGAEWMIRGAYTPSLRVQTAPLGRSRYIYINPCSKLQANTLIHGKQTWLEHANICTYVYTFWPIDIKRTWRISSFTSISHSSTSWFCIWGLILCCISKKSKD